MNARIFGAIPFLKECMNQSDIINAITIPTNGAKKMNAAVFSTTAELTALKPTLATAAPANPPINVCEEEEGIPSHQVSKFQHIAAISPEKIMTIISFPNIPSEFTVFLTVSATP